MINETTLILKQLNFLFLMEMFIAHLPLVYTFRYVFVLQDYVLMLMTSTIETHLTSKLLKQDYQYHELHKAFF